MEKQERKSRIVLFLAFLLTLVCLGLLAAAMGSEHWVAADIRPYSALGEDVHVSTVHHGLFAGELQREAFVQIFHSNITSKCGQTHEYKPRFVTCTKRDIYNINNSWTYQFTNFL